MKKLISLLVVIICIVGCNTKLVGLTNKDSVVDKQDTIYRYCSFGNDSFCIRYIHGKGYMSPLVGRIICDIDSSKKDTMSIVDGSTGIARQEIRFAMKNCRADTAAYIKDRHYYAKVNVYRIVNKKSNLVGGDMFGYYVVDECWDDIPDGYIQKAKYEQSVIDSNISLKKTNGEYAVYKYVVTYTDFITGLDSGGLVIDRFNMQKDFLTAKEAHDFIDEQLSKISSGIDFRLDSTLISKRFQKLLTREEYEVINN